MALWTKVIPSVWQEWLGCGWVLKAGFADGLRRKKGVKDDVKFLALELGGEKIYLSGSNSLPKGFKLSQRLLSKLTEGMGSWSANVCCPSCGCGAELSFPRFLTFLSGRYYHQSTETASYLPKVTQLANTELGFRSVQFSSFQSLSRVQLFVAPWAAARQASLSVTNSRSLLNLMSIELGISLSHIH